LNKKSAVPILWLALVSACTTGSASAQDAGVFDPGQSPVAGRDPDASAFPDRQDEGARRRDDRRRRFDDGRVGDGQGDAGGAADGTRRHGKPGGVRRDHDSDGSFAGAEFRKSTFIDADFRKKLYGGVFRAARPGDAGGDTSDRGAARAPDIDAGSIVADDGCGPLALNRRDPDDPDRREWLHLLAPIPGMLQDWVPDKVHRLQNGGFEKNPDNGSPVPYRLNGHVDIQRKLPWEADD